MCSHRRMLPCILIFFCLFVLLFFFFIASVKSEHYLQEMQIYEAWLYFSISHIIPALWCEWAHRKQLFFIGPSNNLWWSSVKKNEGHQSICEQALNQCTSNAYTLQNTTIHSNALLSNVVHCVAKFGACRLFEMFWCVASSFIRWAALLQCTGILTLERAFSD